MCQGTLLAKLGQCSGANISETVIVINH